MSYQVLFLFGNKTLCPLLLFLKVVDISLDLLYSIFTVSYLLADTPAVLLVLHPLFLELLLSILNLFHLSLNEKHVLSFFTLPRLLTLLLVFELYRVILLKQDIDGHV